LAQHEIRGKWIGCLAAEGAPQQALLERLERLGRDSAESLCGWLAKHTFKE
jgi:hypothetical protein